MGRTYATRPGWRAKARRTRRSTARIRAATTESATATTNGVGKPCPTARRNGWTNGPTTARPSGSTKPGSTAPHNGATRAPLRAGLRASPKATRPRERSSAIRSSSTHGPDPSHLSRCEQDRADARHRAGRLQRGQDPGTDPQGAREDGRRRLEVRVVPASRGQGHVHAGRVHGRSPRGRVHRGRDREEGQRLVGEYPALRRGPARRRLRRGQPWPGHDPVRPAPV
jgi:hypothetical protein